MPPYSKAKGAYPCSGRPVGTKLLLSCILPLTMLAAPALARQGAELGSLTSTRADRICTNLVGLAVGSGQHEFCVRSLQRTAADADQASALVEARDRCLARGAASPSALALCELDTANASSPEYDPGPLPTIADQRVGSFFHTTQDVAFNREQQACAALGLEPVSSAFAGCVANLDASINPPWQGGG